jgi:hypothetical protein
MWFAIGCPGPDDHLRSGTPSNLAMKGDKWNSFQTHLASHSTWMVSAWRQMACKQLEGQESWSLRRQNLKRRGWSEMMPDLAGLLLPLSNNAITVTPQMAHPQVARQDVLSSMRARGLPKCVSIKKETLESINMDIPANQIRSLNMASFMKHDFISR